MIHELVELVLACQGRRYTLYTWVQNTFVTAGRIMFIFWNSSSNKF